MRAPKDAVHLKKSSLLLAHAFGFKTNSGLVSALVTCIWESALPNARNCISPRNSHHLKILLITRAAFGNPYGVPLVRKLRNPRSKTGTCLDHSRQTASTSLVWSKPLWEELCHRPWQKPINHLLLFPFLLDRGFTINDNPLQSDAQGVPWLHRR